MLSVYTGERPFCCNMCSKKFTRSCDLKTHMIIHTGEHPYGCRLCGKKCRKSSDLVRHMLVHTGGRFFRSSVCSKMFARSYTLNVICFFTLPRVWARERCRISLPGSLGIDLKELGVSLRSV